MHTAKLKTFADRASTQLFDHILPFWCGPALDLENGGWMSWLGNELQPDRTQPKGLIVNTRILWAFSAAHRARAEAKYRKMAERARDYVMGNFWDKEHGGGFWRLDDRGKLLDDSKKIYGQAFCIYALTEFHLAFGEHESLERAKEVFNLIERHAHDDRFGGYVEVCRRDWSEAGPEARLSDKDMNEKKSMNNHLHVLEAYTNLHRAWPEATVARRLRELIELFLTRIVDARTSHMNHFFDEQWNVRSDTYTFGHDIEASWLLCEAAEELEDEPLLARVRSMALKMARAVANEGLRADGGLTYEGRDGRILDGGCECWPQAEAVVGFLNAFELSGDETHLEMASMIWDFIERFLVDPVHGEWFWRINEDGKPDPKLPKVSEWKGPYHGSRACLEAARRLHKIIATRNPLT